jgi:hypothetical protein
VFVTKYALPWAKDDSEHARKWVLGEQPQPKGAKKRSG